MKKIIKKGLSKLLAAFNLYISVLYFGLIITMYYVYCSMLKGR